MAQSFCAMGLSGEAPFREAARLHGAGHYRAAERAYLAIAGDPVHAADVASNLSALYLQLGDAGESERRARAALALQPQHANAWNHLGLALRARGNAGAALAAFRRAATLDPRHANAWANLAEILVGGDDITGAIAAYEQALAVEPDLAIALVGYIHRKQQIASWDGLDVALARLSRLIAEGEPAIDPFMLLFCCTDPGEIRRACDNAAKARDARVADVWGAAPFAPAPRRDGPIRIGYVSGNFYDHAVGTLIGQLLEAHDRRRFEVFCYCHSAVKHGARRQRIKAAADHFIEIDTLDDHAAARRIHQDGIDILVDLMGHTKGQRLAIFALRPAPVQATWLGFAGSAGGRAADYIIADRVVIPPGDETFYSEAPVRMPVCYQVNDATRALSAAPMARADCGLPEGRVVFCNFNQTAKITPPVVDLWAAILRQVPDAVIWLWDLYPAGSRNLKRHLAERGVAADRVFFGPTLPEAAHLTRYGLCDLFLDSFPYCGHATASNALFGGVPLVTLPGRTFASRVSASLLTALGLTSLIAASPQDYVGKAVALARDRPRLSALKAHLAAARSTSPLFDGHRFAHDLEAAFTAMHQRRLDGLPPTAIDLPDLGRL